MLNKAQKERFEKDCKEALRVFAAHKGNYTHAARALGIPRTTLLTRIERAARIVPKVPQSDGVNLEHASMEETREAIRLHAMERDLKDLREHNKKLSNELLGLEKIKLLIHDCERPINPPRWLVKLKAKSNTGVPNLFLSDVHWDEVVDPRQINGMNAYNRDIAVRRLRTCFSKTVDLCLNHMAKPSYDYIVLSFGGDMLSGNIHEELRETNEYPIALSMMGLIDHMTAGIDLLVEKFGKVYVPCVVGNHGRWDKKPRAKNRAYESYEWIIYQMLAKHYAKDDRIHFDIADGPDLPYKIYDTRYLLTHGDQARGGSGIAGALSPLMLMDHRKRKRAMATHQEFDYLQMGHWHQRMMVKGLIVNSSVKGYDEWTASMNFEFELPSQQMWITHAEYGITASWPILLERPGVKF